MISFRLLICFIWLVEMLLCLWFWFWQVYFLDISLFFTPEVDEGLGLAVRSEMPDVGRLNVHGLASRESETLLTDDPRAVFIRRNKVDLLDAFVGHRRYIMHGGFRFASLFYLLLK